MNETSEEWARYGRAVIAAMNDVLGEADESARALLLETADYWFSLGLAVGVRDPDRAARLLALIEREEGDRAELEADGVALCEEVLP
jgi:hypothetical protein